MGQSQDIGPEREKETKLASRKKTAQQNPCLINKQTNPEKSDKKIKKTHDFKPGPLKHGTTLLNGLQNQSFGKYFLVDLAIEIGLNGRDKMSNWSQIRLNSSNFVLSELQKIT